jgi:protocatechuate 3,4-dioxygenase beta subunit
MRISRALLALAGLSACVIAPPDAAAQGHAVITGRVVDEQGLPVVNGRVTAWSPDLSAGYRSNRQVAEAQTDDRGIYRVHSLRAGRYVICAARGFQPPPLDESQRLQREIDGLRLTAERNLGPTSEAARARLAELEPRLPARIEPVRGLAPACYTDKTGTRVTLGLAEGEERTGIDLALTRTRLARIEGQVTGLTLAPDEAADLRLLNEDEELGDAREFSSVLAGGAFFLRDIPPGRYALVLTVRPIALRSYTPRDLAAMPIVVRGDDLRNVRLAVPKAAAVTGRLVMRGRSDPPADALAQATVHLEPTEHGALTWRRGGYLAPPAADGSFAFPEVRPGTYRLRAFLRAPTTWFLDTAIMAGRDVAATPIEITPALNVSDVVVTMTDRWPSLAGTVVDDAGQPAPGTTIVLYPKDPRDRTPLTYRLRIGFTTADGDYVILGVRPGAYRVASVRNLAFAAWFEDGFLDRIDPTATTVSIAGDGQTILNLRVRSTDR